MTASALCDGEAVACIIGGWGDMERAMAPVLLHQLNEPESEHQYAWSEPETSGAEPEGRAFHSTSEVARCTLLVYGGLGNGCCRTDVRDAAAVQDIVSIFFWQCRLWSCSVFFYLNERCRERFL